MTKVINEGLMRGAVGKARRQLKRFNDRKETDKAAVCFVCVMLLLVPTTHV